LGDRGADSTTVERRLAGAAGLAVSGAPAPRASGLDRCQMGRLRTEAPCQVLLAHARRPTPARKGSRALGAPLRHGDARGAHDLSECMRILAMLGIGARALLRSDVVDEELAGEMREHLERLVEQNLARGMTAAAARAAAQREFGPVTQLVEESRD